MHNLVDFILPIVAGSSAPESQQNLLETRWKFMHKEPLRESTTYKTLKSVIDALPKPKVKSNIEVPTKIYKTHTVKDSKVSAL